MNTWEIIEGDCREVMADMDAESVDSICTDPPYGIGFMGRDWDHGVPGEHFWVEALRVAKPGAHLLAFGGTRTHHRLMCAIEDAGWEIRDCLCWLYGCLSEDTEVLVDGEWVQYHKATPGRLALAYNADDDTLAWLPIRDTFEYDYSDTAYRVQSDSTDQIVSRNHCCIVERGGRYVFEYAEALERQETVPVLEGLPDLLRDLPVPDQRAGDSESVLRLGVCGAETPSTEAAIRAQDAAGSVRGVRQDGVEVQRASEASVSADVLQAVQRGDPWRGLETARPQGPRGMDRGIKGGAGAEVDRRWKSSLEGRGNVLQETRQLQADQVCAMPQGLGGDGEERRICDGAPDYRSAGDRSAIATAGDGSPHRSRSPEQRDRESEPLCGQPRAQTVRASRYARPDMARITPIRYDGKVWCIRVETGAFVARRNGKVFITGNSGFPKSLDVSKAIDREAGAEREVVGTKVGMPGYSETEGLGSNCYGGGFGGNGSGADECRITAPATPAAHQWAGFGTCLKPAYEPIILARKPLRGTVAANVQACGCGAINIEACRISGKPRTTHKNGNIQRGERHNGHPCGNHNGVVTQSPPGRWPANLLLDESAAAMLDEAVGDLGSHPPTITKRSPDTGSRTGFGVFAGQPEVTIGYGDTGGPSRFFYSSKARTSERCQYLTCDCETVILSAWVEEAPNRDDRTDATSRQPGISEETSADECGCSTLLAQSITICRGKDGRCTGVVVDATSATWSKPRRCAVCGVKVRKTSHPTQKPEDLMRWLVKLVTPPGGTVLDPFTGSGSTGKACAIEGFDFIGIELDREYAETARARIAEASNHLFAGVPA